MTQLRLLAALSVLLVCACSAAEPQAPALTKLSPARASRWFATAMTLSGERLFDDVRVTLDSSRVPSRSGRWKIQIGDDLTIDDVRHPNPQTLRFTVPEGLEAGNYTLTAFSPSGQKVALKGGLTVGEGAAGLVLSIESAADGGGEPIGDRTLRAGDSLDLYAVFRQSDGTFATAGVDVTWSSPGLPDALASASGPTTTFRSESLGETVVSASNPDTDDAQTGSLSVVRGDAAVVSIEDAPGGGGHALSSPTLSTDQSLTFYAVSRDAFGNFVADVEADWHADDVLEADARSGTQSYEYAPAHTGSGRLYADTSLGSASAKITVTGGRATMFSIVPATATLKSGVAQQQFGLQAFDGEGNETTDVGTLTWSIANGPITRLGQDGVLTPERAGIGVVRATSSYGATADSGSITILPGTAAAISFSAGTPLDLTAGDPPVKLSIDGLDAAGNPTTDIGALTWSIGSGDITHIEPATGVLTPTHAGTGVVHATTNGATAESPAITIHAGVAIALAVKPNLAALSADAAPLQFTATATDAYGNVTSPGAALTWSVASGPISAIGASTGLLDPRTAGSGKIKVVNGAGISAQSGTITINPGRAAQLALQPATLTTMLGDPATTFGATGTDADGNVTLDLGTLTYGVASGPIATVSATGALDPTMAGSGTIAVSSSYGASGVSGNVVVQAFSSPVSISAVRASTTWWSGSLKQRIEVDVANNGLREMWLTGLWLTFARSGSDVSSQYATNGSYANGDRIPAQSSTTFTFYTDVIGTPSAGTIDVTANIESFHSTLLVGAQATKATSFTMAATSFGGTVSITAPVVPNNRLCSGGTASFTASGNGFVSMSPSYDWRFPRASSTSGSGTSVTATYTQRGNAPFSVMLTDDLSRTSGAIAPLPIYIGDVATDASLAHPTGWLSFAAPSIGEVLDMGDLPDVSGIGMSGSANARILQCDGTRVPAAGQRYLTFFVDRGKIPMALDQRSDLPGIQRLLTDNADTFPAFTLDNDVLGLEGAAMVYGEAWNGQAQAVTLSGLQGFRMTGDQVRPKVLNTMPVADCSAACYGKGQPLLFRFSEPIDSSTLSNMTVQRLNGTTCAATPLTNLGGTYVYDAPTRTLRVTPSTVGVASYALRVTLPTSITDTAAAANSLLATSRCAIVSALAAAPATVITSVSGPTPFTFSPDGDGTAETTAWTVTVDAQARWFELRVRHAATEVWGETVLVTSAGANAVTWDGRDYTGRVVPNGYYRYDITAYNADGVASAKQTGIVEVASAIHFVGVLRRF